VRKPTRSFPDGFWWGCATSSHQVEGHCDNDWTQWERDPRKIHDGTYSGAAAGWWDGRAEADLDQAADWGHNAVRMSLEWSRLEPEPGRFDEAAFARYRQILDHAKPPNQRAMAGFDHEPRCATQRGNVK